MPTQTTGLGCGFMILGIFYDVARSVSEQLHVGGTHSGDTHERKSRSEDYPGLEVPLLFIMPSATKMSRSGGCVGRDYSSGSDTFRNGAPDSKAWNYTRSSLPRTGKRRAISRLSLCRRCVSSSELMMRSCNVPMSKAEPSITRSPQSDVVIR